MEMLLASILTSLLCSRVCRAPLGTRENRGLSCIWARAGLSTHWTGSTSASGTKPWEQRSQGHVASLYRVWADTSRSLTPDSIHDLCLCCFPVTQRGAQSLGSSPVTVPRVPGLSCLLKHGWSVWQLRNLGRGHHVRLGCDVPHPTVPFGFI